MKTTSCDVPTSNNLEALELMTTSPFAQSLTLVALSGTCNFFKVSRFQFKFE